MGEIVLKNVIKKFGDLTVIENVSLQIKDRGFVVFVGPSGSGKSNLLRLITGLEELSGGQVIIDDRGVSYDKPSSRGLAMVFQSSALFSHINVRDNIGFGLRIAGEPKSEIQKKADNAAFRSTHAAEANPPNGCFGSSFPVRASTFERPLFGPKPVY